MGSDVNEQELRRHLDEAHRQLLERDHAYRFHEEQLRSRDLQIERLSGQLAKTQAWAQELDATIRRMQTTRAWRLALSYRAMRNALRRMLRLGSGSPGRT